MKAYEVIVAGAGVGGICAALAAARSGARTLLVEKASTIGGTGVHSPVSLVCKFHGSDHRPINLGIHQELFPEIYAFSTRDLRSCAPRLTYNEEVLAERYRRLIAAEARLTVSTGTGVAAARVEDGRIVELKLEDGDVVTASVYVDGTADGNLGAAAGCPFHKGRSADGRMQSATVVFSVIGVDPSKTPAGEFRTRGGLNALWKSLSEHYRAAKTRGETDNPRSSVVCFPYPDGGRLLFNSNESLGVDPTDPVSVAAAQANGRRLVDELWAILSRHPAFLDARIDFVADKLGVREGRRIHGDYTLTEEDCLGEARFSDMVAACAYELDIHDPDGGAARMVNIPGSGYYHIPYRCLTAAGVDNLLLGSRCISGTHEAHSSYRVMSGVSAIGQAAGTAAALSARYAEGVVRAVAVPWIRAVLREQVQFVEGDCVFPDDWQSDLS